jgi:hypothetical protein
VFEERHIEKGLKLKNRRQKTGDRIQNENQKTNHENTKIGKPEKRPEVPKTQLSVNSYRLSAKPKSELCDRRSPNEKRKRLGSTAKDWGFILQGYIRVDI